MTSAVKTDLSSGSENSIAVEILGGGSTRINQSEIISVGCNKFFSRDGKLYIMTFHKKEGYYSAREHSV